MTGPMPTLPFDRPDPLQPPPAYAELQKQAPVVACRTADGRPAWLVTSYDAVAAVLGDQRFGVTPPGGNAGEGATLLQDGEPHLRLRRLVGKAFTPRRIEQLRPRIEELAAEWADRLAAGGRSGDLVSGFAAPLSISVIGELLGVAIEERDRFREVMDAASAVDVSAEDGPTEAERAWGEVGRYVGGLIAEKRARLGDDLLSDLIRARDGDDGRLSDYELTTLVLAILASGYLTATSAMSVGATLLVTEGRLARLAEADADEVTAEVEEIVRLQIGLIGEVFPRWAHADVELAGVAIAAGDLVLPRLGAANRDPAYFTDPDALRTDRAADRHLAFGRGPHHCLGAAVARAEIAAALRALARRVPTLALRGSVHDIAWVHGQSDRGPVAIHVTW